MIKKKILKEYEKNVRLLNEYNKFYYNESNPKVADKEYDELKKNILILEKKNKFLKSNESPSKL